MARITSDCCSNQGNSTQMARIASDSQAMAEPATAGATVVEGDLVVLRPGLVRKFGLRLGQPAAVMSVSVYGDIGATKEMMPPCLI